MSPNIFIRWLTPSRHYEILSGCFVSLSLLVKIIWKFYSLKQQFHHEQHAGNPTLRFIQRINTTWILFLWKQFTFCQNIAMLQANFGKNVSLVWSLPNCKFLFLYINNFNLTKKKTIRIVSRIRMISFIPFNSILLAQNSRIWKGMIRGHTWKDILLFDTII